MQNKRYELYKVSITAKELLKFLNFKENMYFIRDIDAKYAGTLGSEDELLTSLSMEIVAEYER